MAPSKTTETDGFDHTSLTCKAFAALLCVSSVAVGCVTLVSALKTQDPIGVYRPDAVRRELPRNGPFMAVETANPHGLHGPGAVSPRPTCCPRRSTRWRSYCARLRRG